MSARFTEAVVWIARVTSAAVVLLILILFAGDSVENGFSPVQLTLHLRIVLQYQGSAVYQFGSDG